MKRQLPVDVLEEILARLQVKDLLRFKSVSKQWLSVISTPSFVRLHLNKSISNPSRHGIFMPYKDTCKMIDYMTSEDVNNQLPRPEEAIGNLTGACDGIICFLDYDDINDTNLSVCLWNPSIRALRTMNLNIPTEGLGLGLGLDRIDTILFSWFGRGGDSNDYKLVIGIRWLKSVDGKKLTSVHVIKPYAEVDKDDYHYHVQPECANELEWDEGEYGILFHGVVHWVAYRVGAGCLVLFWYDLGRKTVGEIAVPNSSESDYDYPATIGVLDGCLVAIWSKINRMEVWVMKEYGVKESWSKLMNVSDFIPMPFSCLTLIGVADNGDFILGTHLLGDDVFIYNKGELISSFCVRGKEVLIYNVAEKKCKTLASKGGFGCPRMYFETLVVP